MEAAARARTNIALVKYWGKRDERLVLPFTGSLSMTLDALWTDTRVEFCGRPGEDELSIDGEKAGGEELSRVTALLDLVRADNPALGAARVESRATVPKAAGLASSASAFAALAAAASWAAGLDPTPRELSILARRGSGSACRSVFGGFVEWTRGERDDGADSHAGTLVEPAAWEVAMCLCLVNAGQKGISSRSAMKASVGTSPFFAEWARTTARDLEEAKEALDARALERLGAVTERSFLKMHAVAMTSDPPALFWKPATLSLLDAVHSLRRRALSAWATVDAGPHVAVLCRRVDAPRVREALAPIPGVRAIIVAGPGRGVERL